MRNDIYLWVCDQGHYVGMSVLGSNNPEYIDNTRKKNGKKLPRCPHCGKGKKRRLYKVTRMELVDDG